MNSTYCDNDSIRHHDCVVLYGGESEEREVSLHSGENVAQALRKAGIETDLYDWNPAKMREFLALGYKKVFIALHGGTGENGMVQAMLEMAAIPFTGVRMRTAAICIDKLASKTIVSGLTNVNVPAGKSLAVYSDAAQIAPWASAGVSICTGMGILEGSGGAFHPQDKLTRAQTAAILLRMP